MSYKNMTTEEILRDLGSRVDAARLSERIDERDWDGVSSATYNRFKKGQGIGLEGFVKLLQQLNRVDELDALLSSGVEHAKNQKRISRKEKMMTVMEPSKYVSPLDDIRVTFEMAQEWQNKGYSLDFANKIAKELNAKDSIEFAWSGLSLQDRFEQILILCDQHKGLFSVKLQAIAFFKMGLPFHRIQDNSEANKERIIAQLIIEKYDFLFEYIGLFESKTSEELIAKASVMAKSLVWLGSMVGQGFVSEIDEEFARQAKRFEKKE